MQDFRKLKVWQKAHALSIEIYGATKSFPAAEQYALRRQIRSATVSVEANIAEGCGRRTAAEFVNFLGIGSGSLCELQCLLLLARDLGFMAARDVELLELTICDIRRMLVGLQNRLKDPKPSLRKLPKPRATNRKQGREAPDATENERSE
jgi:four helix bundle protein